MIRQAVILCGGLGTRLGELTAQTPKPLLPVAGVPFLERLLFEIRRFGICRVLFLASFQADKIRAFAAEAASRLGLEVEAVVEPERAGTGGALWHARQHLDDAFLLFNGDSFFDVNLLDLARLLLDDPDTLAAMSIRAVSDASRYGAVAFEAGRIRRFEEKRGIAAPGWVNGGVYAMRVALVDALTPSCSLEADALALLAPEGRIRGRVFDGFFIDIGVPADYVRAQTELPRAQRRGAFFLDRDGVLDEHAGDVGSRDRFVWRPGAREAVKRLNDMGLFVFVVTDQDGVAHGYYSEEAMRKLHRHMADELAVLGAHIDDVRYGPHRPSGAVDANAKASDWRKREPGMLTDLMSSWPVNLDRSVMIGDKGINAEAGPQAGVTFYQLSRGETLDSVITAVCSQLGIV